MVSYQPETVKGFEDLLPPESQKYEAVKNVVETQFKLYGFLPVKTPSIEFEELMRSEDLNEDEIISDRFRLRDKSGRNLGLRYEFTFQLARIFKQNPNIKLPFRRYQIGSNFRDEPTGPGRFKEFTQCDADIIGDSSIEADAECCALVNDILRDLKISGVIEINSRRLITAILDSVQIQQKLEVMRELDKMDKIGEDAVKMNLKKYADSNQILTLFKLLEKDLDFFVKNIFDGSEDLKKLELLAKQYGCKVKFNPFLVRGLSYYTGNIFEIKIEGTKNSLGGGGRYDKVVGEYSNKDIPAVGISFGLERLTQFSTVKIENPKVVVLSIEQNKEAIKLTQRLRKEGVSSIPVFDKPGKGLEYANALMIPFALFIGKDEIDKKKFKLKNMATGEEKYLSEKQVISALKK